MKLSGSHQQYHNQRDNTNDGGNPAESFAFCRSGKREDGQYAYNAQKEKYTSGDSGKF